MVQTNFVKKIVMLGDGGAGKTCLVRRFVVDMYSDKYIQTIGSKVVKKEVEFLHGEDEVKMTLMVWDVIGQKGFRYTQALSINNIAGAILVCDTTREETLTSLLSYWVPLVLRTSGPVPMVVLGNKWDLEVERKFGTKEIARVAESCPGFGVSEKSYMTSAKTGHNVESAFLHIAESMVFSRTRAQLPDDWHLMDHQEIGDMKDVIDHIMADFAEQFGGIEHATPFIRQQMQLAELDINNPSEAAISAFVENLANIEIAYKRQETIDANRRRRLSLLKSLVKN